MNEGWLFRLRSSLGSQHSVPAWPSAAVDETSTLAPLRRPPARPAAGGEPAMSASREVAPTDASASSLHVTEPVVPED